jgi:hypothetical protein
MKHIIIKGCNKCPYKRFHENYLKWYCGDLEENHSMTTYIDDEIKGKTIHSFCQLKDFNAEAQSTQRKNNND